MLKIVFLCIQLSMLIAFVKSTSVASRRELIAVFYENRDLCGAKIELYANERIQNLVNWNDRISSYIIYKPVTVYEHFYGEGSALHLTPCSSNVPHGWDNRISSIFDTATLNNLVAVLYEHFDFCGAKISLASGERLQWLAHWNDRISSVIVHKDLRVHEHVFGYGVSQTYHRCRINNLGHLNDKISSLYDAGENEVIAYLYEHRHFGGRVIKLYRNERLTSLGPLNDIVSSYKALRRVVVCEHTFHEGNCLTLNPGKCDDIGARWNDRISSAYDEK